jgi:SnoaL-like domain
LSESPIEQLLVAIDKLDVDRAMALMASDVRFLAVDGRRAQGSHAVRELLAGFVASLRSTTHQITAQWHQDNVWIAEVEARYELTDRVRIGPLPRAFVMREGAQGFADLSVYGAHERPLTDYDTGEHMMRLGGHWMPPL